MRCAATSCARSTISTGGAPAGRCPPFARVVIETSGLADPGPVIQALLAEPTLRARYALGNVVALVDAVNGLATLEAHVEALKQAAVADRIVLTKLDLARSTPTAAAGAALLRERLAAINPAADVIDVSSAPPVETVFGAPSFDRTRSAAGVETWLKWDRYPSRPPRSASRANRGTTRASARSASCATSR